MLAKGGSTMTGLETMREACRRAAAVLDDLEDLVVPGISTYELDQEAKKIMDRYEVQSACFQYRHGPLVFPSYTCLSVNDEIIHGIGTLKRILREGDIVTLDVCVNYQGWVGDNARTVRVGAVSEEVNRLLKVTEEALYKGIAEARVGNRIGAVSNAVQRCVESHGFSVVREFVGHGVGKSMHQPPQIPNYGSKRSGPPIRKGMTLAIEPMVNMGDAAIRMLDDGWTAVTRDGKMAAHFEHTVLVTDGAPEILTLSKKNTSQNENIC
jgi:methionyl aminopeptidase